jgi:hypothetical protein
MLLRFNSLAAITSVKNYVDKSKTKHIVIRHHFVSKVSDKTVKLMFIPGRHSHITAELEPQWSTGRITSTFDVIIKVNMIFTVVSV